MKTTNCMECGEPLVGRSDKKFCSDYCRNTSNNRKNRAKREAMRVTNRILQQNYRILLTYYQNGKTETRTDELEQNGFNFNFMTRVQNDSGRQRAYCYDMAYSIVNQEKVYLERVDRFQSK